ncbi:PRELI domain-containing protein 1, mitochondrial-like [Xiphias gladius]|uniref:PRELI domain-containing protein 1, mitochondrial-like n=1 Tax=Xiphias gladius TaxID=8245 RepID=UPI001A983D81|nr:PRELI domain-containing protein 1, mitochondrial-like [Xiphias gladius]XP_040001229.1 PRELI domain-containing protein 1, mitochondrial-like [Xiphias gladius]XP_040001230.1 PRELI domain-containing protein 1, mitochondrial-like [Xiphias gladius]XP_040001231.1 PRELI domain-containing protein 1, mitochondrial-like [Xiphias gladius]
MSSDFRTVSDFGWSQHPSFHRFVQSQQGTSGFGIQAVLHISERRMVKYFCNNIDIRSTWDHVVSAFWQRYPNPFSTHVLTEDVVYREVTADHHLVSRRLLTKTNRLPRWAERFFPTGMSRSVYIIEDSVVDPVNRSLTTYTWNLNHTTLMSVEERCVFQDSAEQPANTQLKREAWISSSVYGFSRPIQEFGLARLKSNQVKAMKGLEYALSNLQGETPQWLLRYTVKDASGKAKEAAKNLASAAAAPQKPQQYI